MAKRNHLILFTGVVALAGFSRLWRLDYDPPTWQQSAYLTDEGWWADSARGAFFFDDPFSDDFGTALLITPGYHKTLLATYRLLGVGLTQTRIPSAASGVVAIVLIALLLFRVAGPRAALLGAALMTVSPITWMYARVALLESLQVVWLIVAFGAFVLFWRRWWGGLVAGLAMMMAIAVKPNAIYMMCVAFPLIAFVIYWSKVNARRSELTKPFVRAVIATVAAFAIAMAWIYFDTIKPNNEAFARLAGSESGFGRHRWTYRLRAIPGLAFMAYERGHPAMQAVLRLSPAIFIGAWLGALRMIAYRPSAENGDQEPRERVIGIAASIWAIGAWLPIPLLVFEFQDHKYLPILPGLCLIAAMHLSRCMGLGSAGGYGPAQARRAGGFAHSMAIWFLVALPVFVAVKAPLSQLIMNISRSLPTGRVPGLGAESSGLMVTLAAASVLVLFARNGESGLAHARRLAAPRVAWAVAALMILEVARIGGAFATGVRTFPVVQEELGSIVTDGDVVFGHESTTVFLPLRVRTVRRTRIEDTTPAPNLDVWDRLHPRFIMEKRIHEFEPTAHGIYDDLIARGYELRREIELGQVRNGVSRYKFDLYERTADCVEE